MAALLTMRPIGFPVATAMTGDGHARRLPPPEVTLPEPSRCRPLQVVAVAFDRCRQVRRAGAEAEHDTFGRASKLPSEVDSRAVVRPVWDLPSLVRTTAHTASSDGGLAQRGFELLDLDDRPVVDDRGHRCGRQHDAGRPLRGDQVGRYRAGVVVLQRCRPAIELFQPHPIRCHVVRTIWGRSTAAGIVTGPTDTVIVEDAAGGAGRR